MSWHYLQEPGEESSVVCCTGGEPCAPLKSKITHAEFYCKGSLTESYLNSLSGTMFVPSTEIHGEEKLISSQEDSPAKIFQSPEKEQDYRGQGLDSGGRWPASLARYDPVSSLWKTHQCSLLGDLEPFSETWPNWGMMQNGEFWEQTMPELVTEEKESGYWPTPQKRDTCARVKSENWKGDDLPSTVNDRGGTTTLPMALNPSWVEWLMGWPIGWTDLQPLGMAKFQQWLNSHGTS